MNRKRRKIQQAYPASAALALVTDRLDAVTFRPLNAGIERGRNSGPSSDGLLGSLMFGMAVDLFVRRTNVSVGRKHFVGILLLLCRLSTTTKKESVKI